MPKSGFDPQRHQRKHRRHNPLGGAAPKSSAAGTGASAAAAGKAPASTLEAIQQAIPAKEKPTDQIIPLLANLPLPDTPASQQSSINVSDKIWSLASVSLLLSASAQSGHTPSETKQNRRLLLSHNIIARIVYALHSDTNVEVRREASGALRNLCVDAGFDVRAEVANKGGVDAILGAMRWSANALGFYVDGSSAAPGSSSLTVEAPSADEDLERKRALLSKPLDQMNKKERRHTAKIAASLGKSLEDIAGKGLSAEDEQALIGRASNSGQANGNSTSLPQSASSSSRSEPFVHLDSEIRKGLLEMSENLATITWCLCETGGKSFGKLVSWKWVDEELFGDQGELPGQGLATWLCGAVALGCRAASVLSTANAEGTRPSNADDALASLRNEELSVLLDLAIASANALCGLTDGGEADFVNGFLGRRIPKAPKKGAKSAKVDEVLPQSLSEQPEQATKRLAEMDRAIALLEACVVTDQSGLDKIKRYVLSQTTMLGVLASGTIRNLAASAARTTAESRKRKKAAFSPANIFVPSRTDANTAVDLKRYEETHILPALTHLLGSIDVTALAHDLEAKGAAQNDQSADVEGSEAAKLQVRAEEKAQTLMLATEVLAEMASGFDTLAADNEDEEWMEDLDASGDDDEMETEDDIGALARGDGENDDDAMDEAVQDSFADAVKRGGSLKFDAFAPVLSRLIVPSTENAAALVQALVPLARPFESSFPSLADGVSGSEEAPTLLRGIHSRALSVLNNVFLRLAAFAPPPPSQPLSSPRDQRRVAAFRSWLSEGGAPQLETAFQSLYEIARGCASVPAVATASSAPAVEEQAPGKGSTEAQDGLTMVETCVGSMWSIARCLDGRVPLDATPTYPSDDGSASAEVVTALTAAYHSARSDGMRVKTLALLATVARCPNIRVDLNENLASFLVQALENVNDKPTPSSTTAEAMVAAVNGIIDTFADENAHYDAPVFRKLGLLKRIRATVFRCRSLVSFVHEMILRQGDSY